jgi:hypothetical protein
MTSHSWQRSVHPGAMLRALDGRTTERKMRLFATAACRRLLPLLPEDRDRRAIETVARYADGLADDADLRAAVSACAPHRGGPGDRRAGRAAGYLDRGKNRRPPRDQQPSLRGAYPP